MRSIVFPPALLLLFSCLTFALPASAGASAPQAPAMPRALVLHVSPAGNDAWSGRPASPAPDGKDGPLATPGGAQRRVRELKNAPGGLAGPVTVLLREGTYPQTAALEFTPADSGTATCPVTYAAYPGEHPVISGGRPIRGWKPDDSPQSRERCGGKLWRADLPVSTDAGSPAWRFNQLFVGDRRRTRTRIPNSREFLRTDGPVAKEDARSFYFKPGDLRPWTNPRDVLVVVYHSWETSLHHIESLDTAANVAVLREPAPWPMGHWERQQRYYVENVFEGLDQPGEWYLDQVSAKLYYFPLPGETIAGFEAVVPVVTSTLVEFRGEPAKGSFVEHLHFRGLAFQHANSQLRRIRNPGQGEIYQPALIQAAGLRHASFEGCEIAHTGAHGAWMAEGCSEVRFERCHVHDLGGGGIYIGGGWGVGEAAPAGHITVENCFIHDGSYQFRGAHGVWIGRSSFNRVCHNEISNFDYSGISCGWSWGFQPSSANHNQLDYNHIHHLGNGDGLGDMGGIYTLGISPGTTERYNHVHDVFNYAHVSHGSGIYPDEGSSEILIENNVVYRVRTCPLFQHYGKDNLVRNNILALGGEAQIRRCREDVPCHFAAEGNIVYGDEPAMLAGVWKNKDWKLARNLYWCTTGRPEFAGKDLADWQAGGQDAGSAVADPLFVDPAKGDFRLQPGSPALAMGFKPIDLSRTGLQGDPHWTRLPDRYPNRTLKEIPAPVEPRFVVHFDFEADPAGAEPLEGHCMAGGEGASIRVSTGTAAGGKHSLQFTDAPGLKHAWMPHLFYRTNYDTGKILLSWDMCNSRQSPARFSIEARQYEQGGTGAYTTGPHLAMSPDGKVTAGGQDLGAVPLGSWAHVEIAMDLGPGAPSTYQIELRAPGREPVSRVLPYSGKNFREIHWLGVSSASETAACFHLDNLRMGTAEELAKPPKRRPRRTAETKAAPAPAEPARLAGSWSFEDDDSWVARDRSGCGNDADVQANWAKGAFGTALVCDAAAPMARVKDAPSLRFGTGDFSIQLWICPTQLQIDSKDARRRFMSKDHHPDSWWNLNLTSEGKPFLEMVDANRKSCANRPNGTIPAHAWTHLAVVVDRQQGQTLYYFNGKLDSAQKLPADFTGNLDVAGGDLSIGSSWQPFIGLLDEVKIHRRALSAAEIQAAYEQDKPRRVSTEFRVQD